LLDRVFRALDRTVGRTLLDPRAGRLMHEDAAEIERELLGAEGHPSDRVGVGLALGFLQRSRRRRRAEGGLSFGGSRGPYLVRQRNDSSAQQVKP
jgi:hypothetical protein